jgi:hypothetical protein
MPTTPRSNHECAAPGCHQLVGPHLLMCRRHWLRVPQTIRDRVNAEHQHQPQSRAHLRAIVDAIKSLQEQRVA